MAKFPQAAAQVAIQIQRETEAEMVASAARGKQDGHLI
jgi:hypothetical protein